MSRKQLSLVDWGGTGSAINSNDDLQERVSTLDISCTVDGKLSLRISNETETLHTGKWTQEEMDYAEGLIDEFKSGQLALPDGTSLRQFLAKMLNCSPKRISKRYEGNNYSKGRKFYVKSTEKLDPPEAQRRRMKLLGLERKYTNKLLHLKMPHLLLANPAAEIPKEETPKQKNKAKTVDYVREVPRSNASEGLPGTTAGLRPSLPMSSSAATRASLPSLRMAATNLFSHTSLTPSLQVPLPTHGTNAMPLSTLTAARRDIVATNTLSSLADDGGALPFLTQLSTQQQDYLHLSATLEARRRIGVTRDLGILGLPGGLLGRSPLLADFPNQALAHSSSLGAAINQQRLHHLLRAEELRTAAQQSVAAAALTRQGVNAAPLPSSLLAARPPATSRVPPVSTSLLHSRDQGGRTTGKGKKRPASEDDVQQQDAQNSSTSTSRRRLSGHGEGRLG